MPAMFNDPYANIHHVPNLTEPTENDLKGIIQTFPLIDNHAHNLLREEEAYGSTDYPFESITSEASGHALQEHVHSTLAHIRGIRQLAELLDCAPSLQDVKAARYEWTIRDYDGFIRTCLAGTHALLLDDGLPQDCVYPVQWHEAHAPTVRRIARIEAVAAELLEQLAHAAGFLAPGVDSDWAINRSEAFLVRFNTMFRSMIKTLAADPSVCGFKSVVCYRSGLDVNLSSRHAFRPHQSLEDTSLLTAFHAFLRQAVREHNYKVCDKDVNDFLVVATCDVLSKLVETEGETLPLQFHTGLGDNDIDLVKANPAYMQPLIEAFPNVDFVILHSSYPYTQSAGYLAATYANAWLDIGEVFPMVSRQGQLDILRESLEIAPASKILWSTDGHFYPETFYLANRQFREALDVVLGELVSGHDVTILQAINIATDILFWNSNSLYKLDEQQRYPQLLRACGRSDSTSQRSTLVDHREADQNAIDPTRGSFRNAGLDSLASTAVPSPATQRTRRTVLGTHTPHRTLTRLSDPFTDARAITMSTSASASPNTTRQVGRNAQTHPDEVLFDNFMAQNPDIKYIWLQFISNTATLRNRMIPVKQFRKHISKGSWPGITKALPRLLQNEWPATGCIATGEFQLLPDMNSLAMNKGLDSPSATVQTWWMDTNDGGISTHFDRCPRWALQSQTQAISDEFDLRILMGFEVEVIFVRPVMNESGSNFIDFDVVHETHSWSNMTYQQIDMLPMIETIVESLGEIGVELEQFHAEAAPTQWEFPLPATSPVKAVDQLYKVRDVIANIAKQHGYKATLYPRPYPMAPGSASHAHFSINGTPDQVSHHSDSFLAGILTHLPSLLAFSLPLTESYERVKPGVWAGGVWATWGTQNREVPLRKCGPGHWEMKTVDGLANMYLTMAAVLAAGLDGLRQNLPLLQKDTLLDASTLTDEQRTNLGITTKLPTTLNESLSLLKANDLLRILLGNGIIEDYLAVKESEMKFLDSMEEKDRKIWLMSRY